MAELKGKLVICDRCGETVFVRTTGEGETDGGFTRWNKFEDLPEGWKRQYDPGMLCPRCNREYEAMITSFMEIAKINESAV